MVEVGLCVNLELSTRNNEEVHPISSLPLDREVIRPVGNPVDRLRIHRHCFMSVDVNDPRRFQDDYDSLRWRLFDEGSIIRRPGFTYYIHHETITRNMLEMALEVQRSLLDAQYLDGRSVLVQVVSIHIVSLPDVGMGEYGEDEEASIFDDDEEVRIVEESFQSAMGFNASPASRKVVASLGRTRVDNGRDCTICFEELSPMADHTFMPCRHIFHDACIMKWLEMRHTCPLCRFSLPQEEVK